MSQSPLAKQLLAEAKRLCENGDLPASLAKCQEAYSLTPSEKLASKIRKLSIIIAEEKEEGADKQSDDEQYFLKPLAPPPRRRRSDDARDDEASEKENDGPPGGGGGGSTQELCPGFSLGRRVAEKLYDHQRDGVAWLFGLHKARKGGILADDMGLGKTIQVIAFLTGLLDQRHIRSVLIIMPVSVMMTWEQEFNKWAPHVPLYFYHGLTKSQMAANLSRVQRRSGVLVTTYGMVVSSWETLSCDDRNRTFRWDYVILDEGHKIKNASRKTSKGVFSIDARQRLILTGTAVQNNLMEMWTLFDFVHHGTLLGSQKTFKVEYERPICKSREKDATHGERRYGDQMAESLKARIGPYFLRRTKDQIFGKDPSRVGGVVGGGSGGGASLPKLTRKNDIVVWIFLSPTQQTIYRDFLQLDHVKELLVGSNKRSPLVELTVLKKICDHPRLLSANQCRDLGLHTAEDLIGRERQNPADGVSVSHLLQESSKMAFLADLMDELKRDGHRTLVFSQSRRMLDIVEKILGERGHRLCRLDGRITQLAERQQLVNKFSTDKRINAFLLTTQVGGVGLTLTAADRVVILDPSWNPAVDAQAVDRAFRIGQRQNVLIYRLITCATVEEKIYRRQIFKDSITRQTTGIASTDKNPYRYFTKQELRELFTLDDPHRSFTQQQLAELHATQRRTDPQLDDHLAFLHTLSIFGISDHDLMFSQEDSGAPEPEAEAIGGNDGFVEQRRQKVEETLLRESEENAMERDARITMSRMELSCTLPIGKLAPPVQPAPGSAREKIQASMNQFIPLSRPPLPRATPQSTQPPGVGSGASSGASGGGGGGNLGPRAKSPVARIAPDNNYSSSSSYGGGVGVGASSAPTAAHVINISSSSGGSDRDGDLRATMPPPPAPAGSATDAVDALSSSVLAMSVSDGGDPDADVAGDAAGEVEAGAEAGAGEVQANSRRISDTRNSEADVVTDEESFADDEAEEKDEASKAAVEEEAEEWDDDEEEEEEEEPIEVVELSSSDESLQEALQSQEMHSLLSKSFGAAGTEAATASFDVDNDADVDDDANSDADDADVGSPAPASARHQETRIFVRDSFDESPSAANSASGGANLRGSISSTPLRRLPPKDAVLETPPPQQQQQQQQQQPPAPADVSMASGAGNEMSVDASPLFHAGVRGSRRFMVVSDDSE